MIRSSLESETYILQGAFSPCQVPDRAGRRLLNPAQPAPQVSWRWRPVAVGFAVLAVIVVVTIRVRGAPFDWRLFLRTLAQVDVRWLALAILLIFITYLFRAWRWAVMLRPMNAEIRFRRLVYDTVIGFTAAVLLGRVGEMVRPYLISVSARVSFSSQVSVWVLERLLDMLVVLLLFGFVLLRIPSHGLNVGPHVRWVLDVGGYVAALMGAACLAIVLLLRNFSEFSRKRLLSALTFLPSAQYERASALIEALAAGVQSTRDLGSLVRLGFFSSALWTIMIASYYCLLRSFASQSPLSLVDVIVVFGFMCFGSVLQIPGLGGGVQVACILCLTEVYHLSLEAATGMALFIWFVSLASVVPLGIFCALHEGLNWRKINQLPIAGWSREVSG